MHTCYWQWSWKKGVWAFTTDTYKVLWIKFLKKKEEKKREKKRKAWIWSADFSSLIWFVGSYYSFFFFPLLWVFGQLPNICKKVSWILAWMTVTQKIPATTVSFAIHYDSGEKKKKKKNRFRHHDYSKDDVTQQVMQRAVVWAGPSLTACTLTTSTVSW